jgi:ATP adenylyltransferase
MVIPDLIARIEAVAARALASGALLPIDSETAVVEEGGIPFALKWVSSLGLKDLAKMARPAAPPDPNSNPFLPYDEALFIADISPTHVVLLNKFPAMANHVLLVTRAFAEQTAPLDLTDCRAIADLLRSLEGLVFLNGGKQAGASQRHKHLQLVPMRAAIEAVLPSTRVELPQRLPQLPFAHAFVSLDEDDLQQPERLLQRFGQCCTEAGVSLVEGQLSAYNLLLTRRWLMIVPRTRECWEQGELKLSINALGFAGSLLLRSAEQFEAVRAAGVANLLRAVTT